MLGLPDEYRENQQFDINTIIPKDIKTNAKKRLRDAIKSVELSHQIKNEIIPSVINEEYNCQVIIFFNVELHKMKDAGIVAEVLQEKIKALCVIRLYDNMNECYSFAHKRLNKLDSTKVVIVSNFLTKQMPIKMIDDLKRKMNEYAYFDSILNTNTKLSFYLEMAVKTYILSNSHLYSKADGLLQLKNIWFNVKEIDETYQLFKRVKQLKEEVKSISILSEKAKINAELKELIKQLDKKLEV